MRLGNSTSIGPAIASIGKDRQRALDSSSSDCLYRRPLGVRPSPAGFNCLILLRSLLCVHVRPSQWLRFVLNVRCVLSRNRSPAPFSAGFNRSIALRTPKTREAPPRGGLHCFAMLASDENYNPQRTGSVCLSLLWCVSSCISALAFSNSSLLLLQCSIPCHPPHRTPSKVRKLRFLSESSWLPWQFGEIRA